MPFKLAGLLVWLATLPNCLTSEGDELCHSLLYSIHTSNELPVVWLLVWNQTGVVGPRLGPISVVWLISESLFLWLLVWNVWCGWS